MHFLQNCTSTFIHALLNLSFLKRSFENKYIIIIIIIKKDFQNTLPSDQWSGMKNGCQRLNEERSESKCYRGELLVEKERKKRFLPNLMPFLTLLDP